MRGNESTMLPDHNSRDLLCRNKLYTMHFSEVSSVGIQSFMEEAKLSKDCVLSTWRGSQFSRDDYVKLNTSPRAYT